MTLYNQLQYTLIGLTGGDFVLCPPEALELENRKLRIVEEIVRTGPGIVCLEECDQFGFLRERLLKFGYYGEFHKKNDSPCLKMEPNWGPDGVAIFYLGDKFDLDKPDIFRLNLKDRDGKEMSQVALVCKFRVKGFPENTGTFYVAVTHFKAKPGFEKVRHAQAESLMQQLTDLVGDSPLVICGDFNGTTEEPFYAEMSDCTHMRYPLKLASAYTFHSSECVEPPYTTWKVRAGKDGNHEVSRTIDYIWFRKEKAVVKSLPRNSERKRNWQK